ncbi:caspase family protein [Endothiovibrio diazotrophicus]
MIATLFLFGVGTADAAGDRVALVVGNSEYMHAPFLPNPANDALDIREKLTSLGFDVKLIQDASRTQLEDAIRKFSKALRGSSVGLFFYAGHGLQVHGENYLVPIDAALMDEADIQFETVSVDVVMDQMERDSRISLVFLDACRDNPLANKLARSMGTSRSTSVARGLGQIEAGMGTLLAYSTQPGNVAVDGDGRNSPFTAALLEHIGEGGLEVRQLLTRVRADVIKKSNGKQIPWDHSSLVDDFYFSQKKDSAQSTVTAEKYFWEKCDTSNSADYCAAYLAEYPAGAYVSLANIKLRHIRREEQRRTEKNKIQEEKDTINALQKKCNTYLQVGKLVSSHGEEENAAKCYFHILELDAGNHKATEGLKIVADRLVELIKNEIEAKSLKFAERHIDQLSENFPGDRRISDLKISKEAATPRPTPAQDEDSRREQQRSTRTFVGW